MSYLRKNRSVSKIYNLESLVLEIQRDIPKSYYLRSDISEFVDTLLVPTSVMQGATYKDIRTVHSDLAGILLDLLNS